MRKLLVGLTVLGLLGFFCLPLGAEGLKGKVAVILDVGGRGDLSFNDMGFKGTDEAARDFGLEMVEIQSATAASQSPSGFVGLFDRRVGKRHCHADFRARFAGRPSFPTLHRRFYTPDSLRIQYRSCATSSARCFGAKILFSPGFFHYEHPPTSPSRSARCRRGPSFKTHVSTGTLYEFRRRKVGRAHASRSL